MIEERKKKQKQLAAEEVYGHLSVPNGNESSSQNVLTEGPESQTTDPNEIELTNKHKTGYIGPVALHICDENFPICLQFQPQIRVRKHYKQV